MNARARPELMVLALGLTVAACRENKATPPKPAPCVPKVLVAKRGTPALERGLDQPVWHDAQATAAFVDETRARPVPHTEARASWDDGAIHLTLYAADDELRASDRLYVELGEARSLEASADRRLRCRFGAESDCAVLGIGSSFQVDGDVDATAQEDEEWSVAFSVPWRALSPDARPSELAAAFRRDDSPSGQPLRLVWSRDCGVIRLQ